MPSDGELETALLAEVDASLAELSAHVTTWINDRFLTSESATTLNAEDVTGLIAWLRQWHGHFDGYAERAEALEAAGRPALRARLAQIRSEIDASIANFTQMAGTLLSDSTLSDNKDN